MTAKPYCTQNSGDCLNCSLVNYGRDCRNNPVGRGGAGRGQGRKKIVPDDATLKRIMMTDAEEIAVRELLKTMRGKD